VVFIHIPQFERRERERKKDYLMVTILMCLEPLFKLILKARISQTMPRYIYAYTVKNIFKIFYHNIFFLSNQLYN